MFAIFRYFSAVKLTSKLSVKKRRAETMVIILTMLLNDNELLLLSQNITLDFELKTLSLSKNRPENQSIYALFLII